MKSLPRRVVILTNDGESRLETIIQDLKTAGRSKHCPNWNWITPLPMDSCIICKQMFPRIIIWADSHFDRTTCPCIVYSPNYLIKRLREILRHNESEPR